jgi:hypothetical protein
MQEPLSFLINAASCGRNSKRISGRGVDEVRLVAPLARPHSTEEGSFDKRCELSHLAGHQVLGACENLVALGLATSPAAHSTT